MTTTPDKLAELAPLCTKLADAWDDLEAALLEWERTR